MARYFFNTTNGETHEDTHGVDLPHVGDVAQHAISYLGELIAHEPRLVSKDVDFMVEAKDAAGLTICRVSVMLTDAFAIRG